MRATAHNACAVVRCVWWLPTDVYEHTLSHFHSCVMLHLHLIPIIQIGVLEVQAFAALQRMLDPTLDYLMRPSRAFRHAESTEQMARELQNYLSKSIAV